MSKICLNTQNNPNCKGVKSHVSKTCGSCYCYSRKGKTYEELYGKEKALVLKKQRSYDLKSFIHNNPEYYEKIKLHCKNNSDFYSIWVSKFGEEIAKKKYQEWLLNKNTTKKGNDNISKRDDVRLLISKSKIEMWQNKEYREKQSEIMLNNNFNIGRKTSQETKKKQRIAAINQIKEKYRANFHPNYNKKACEYFDKLMIETKTNIQHAENGGEFHIESLGYWVDGYDKENNIVYEYDEKKHSYKNKKQKDIERQNEIINLLNCQFIRIKI